MAGKVKLTFDKTKDATPLATVSGGEYNKDVLYLQTGESKSSGKKGVQELEIGKHRLKKLSPRKQSEVMRVLQEAFKKGIPPEHLNLGEIDGAEEVYREMLGEVEQKGSTKIKLPPGSTFSLNVNPDPEKRFIYYIAGASGSGKSYIAKHIAEQYQKQFKGRPVYLVSKLKEDETLDGMTDRPIRLNIEKLMATPMKDLEPLRESLVIFDDYDTLQGKEAKAVQTLIDDICIMGRHTVTSILILSHHLSNYKSTRLCLTEATHFVVYPQSTGAHALNYFLKTYVGMGPKEVQAIKNTGSRWLCIHKNFPIYYITETEAGLINSE
jgi:hypothetical protein